MRDHLLCCLESRAMVPFKKMTTHNQRQDSVDLTSSTPEELKWQNPKRPVKPFQNDNKGEPISTKNRYHTLEQIDTLHNVIHHNTPVSVTSNPNLHHASSTEPSPPPTMPSQDHQNKTCEDTLQPTANTETLHDYVTIIDDYHTSSSTTSSCQDQQNKDYQETSTPLLIMPSSTIKPPN